jgi:hypothetical protein
MRISHGPSISAGGLKCVRPRGGWLVAWRTGYLQTSSLHDSTEGTQVLLILAIILLIIAIAGGVIIHPLLFILAIVALVLFFADRRRI